MDKYGEVWKNHPTKIFQSVSQLCSPEDILLVPGDISWASNLKEAASDLEFIASLPCKVVMSEGNHDNWASKYNDLIAALPKNAVWAQRGCYQIGNLAIVSTRLWDFDDVVWPGKINSRAADPVKIQNREITRLENALKNLPQSNDIIRILMVHFPPISFDASPGRISDIINKYNVDYCVYGHLHGESEKVPGMDCVVGKTRFLLTSSDWLKMTPIEVCEFMT
ncbi:serine/threonine protein phosphatase [Histomonas meleagridis]|uniref:serine/threonine protein phosphatase n=1 Tax=Histomonas meleagridis TaxID=135588 RepID=UPI00355AC42F|nr:serine/threonine protein phosphatase [Histomonas meleagridis]KAH0797073.1 serine/threonine protein phosphatase [Histomonas meleagridis]